MKKNVVVIPLILIFYFSAMTANDTHHHTKKNKQNTTAYWAKKMLGAGLIVGGVITGLLHNNNIQQLRTLKTSNAELGEWLEQERRQRIEDAPPKIATINDIIDQAPKDAITTPPGKSDSLVIRLFKSVKYIQLIPYGSSIVSIIAGIMIIKD